MPGSPPRPGLFHGARTEPLTRCSKKAILCRLKSYYFCVESPVVYVGGQLWATCSQRLEVEKPRVSDLGTTGLKLIAPLFRWCVFIIRPVTITEFRGSGPANVPGVALRKEPPFIR